LVIAFVAGGACSSHGPTAHPQPGGGDGGRTTAEAAPSEAECDTMFEHAIALQAEPADSADDRAKLRAELRTAQLPRCRAMARASYTCAIAATTLDAFTACDSRQP
jgi:hypothetical protein